MNNLLKKFKKISELKIAVLGDIMLDKYISGYCERISPEAPVPVVVVENEYSCLGGAGNVAANLLGLGSCVFPIGNIGEDSHGDAIINIFKDLNCSVQHILKLSHHSTITKTRVLANGQQVIRVDNEKNNYFSNDSDLMGQINKLLNDIDLLIISDYGKGCCTDKLLKYTIKKCKDKKLPVLIDPRKWTADFNNYKYCTCITPNFKETKSLLPNIKNIDDDIAYAAKYISQKYSIKNVIITRGDKGMSVLSNNEQVHHLSTEAKKVFDVSGAGDTVIATLGVCLALGLTYIDAARIANIAAGIVVSYHGTTPININELNKKLEARK